MSTPQTHYSPIRVSVDLTNPGQFFACCGLLELADRLWGSLDVRGGFGSRFFDLTVGSSEGSLRQLIDEFWKAEVRQLDIDDNAASPLHLGDPFDLRLDWWSKCEGPNETRMDLGGGSVPDLFRCGLDKRSRLL